MLNAGMYDTTSKSHLIGSTEITLRANVENQNDPPVIKKSTLTLPQALPYNQSEITGDGTKISDLLTNEVVSDPDGGSIGTRFFYEQWFFGPNSNAA